MCLPALGECTPQSEAFQQRCFLHFLVAAASGTYSVCACVCVSSCFNLEYQCFPSCAEVQDTFFSACVGGDGKCTYIFPHALLTWTLTLSSSHCAPPCLRTSVCVGNVRGGKMSAGSRFVIFCMCAQALELTPSLLPLFFARSVS